MPSVSTLRETVCPNLTLFRRGKVRDVFDLGDELLIVATDRISAFDVVMPNAIPDKGAMLTRISKFWFDYIKDICPHHFITDNVDEYPPECDEYADQLRGRSMLVKRTDPLPVECIVRGYLAGSGWIEYRKSRSVCGVDLPAGLKESEQLPEPIFTPSTKAEVGHDENITFEEATAILGSRVAAEVREKSLAVYTYAARYAESRGIIIADTKFEFGILDDEVILIDEVLTPDSSRFWPLESYAPGSGQPSFDKQFLRDYLLSIKWDKRPPAPELPAEIISQTSEKYHEALRLLIDETP